MSGCCQQISLVESCFYIYKSFDEINFAFLSNIEVKLLFHENCTLGCNFVQSLYNDLSHVRNTFFTSSIFILYYISLGGQKVPKMYSFLFCGFHRIRFFICAYFDKGSYIFLRPRIPRIKSISLAQKKKK